MDDLNDADASNVNIYLFHEKILFSIKRIMRALSLDRYLCVKWGVLGIQVGQLYMFLPAGHMGGGVCFTGCEHERCPKKKTVGSSSPSAIAVFK